MRAMSARRRRPSTIRPTMTPANASKPRKAVAMSPSHRSQDPPSSSLHSGAPLPQDGRKTNEDPSWGRFVAPPPGPETADDLQVRRERTTGFEPATLTLAMFRASTPPPASMRIDAAWWASLADHSRPLSPVVVDGACVFCAARISESRTTCTTAAAGARGPGRVQRQKGRRDAPRRPLPTRHFLWQSKWRQM
jgi:hypothetical protein